MSNSSKVLKELRKKHGYSLEYIADKINSTTATISRYENGERKINSANLIKLSKLFNVSPEFLLGETEATEIHIRTKDDLKKEMMAFYGDENISDEDKEEIFNALQEFYYFQKLKQKKEK